MPDLEKPDLGTLEIPMDELDNALKDMVTPEEPEEEMTPDETPDEPEDENAPEEGEEEPEDEPSESPSIKALADLNTPKEITDALKKLSKEERGQIAVHIKNLHATAEECKANAERTLTQTDEFTKHFKDVTIPNLVKKLKEGKVDDKHVEELVNGLWGVVQTNYEKADKMQNAIVAKKFGNRLTDYLAGFDVDPQEWFKNNPELGPVLFSVIKSLPPERHAAALKFLRPAIEASMTKRTSKARPADKKPPRKDDLESYANALHAQLEKRKER